MNEAVGRELFRDNVCKLYEEGDATGMLQYLAVTWAVTEAAGDSSGHTHSATTATAATDSRYESSPADKALNWDSNLDPALTHTRSVGVWDPLILWICPTRQLLESIAHQVRSAGLSSVCSVGCGTGLFEWLLSSVTGLSVTGIEVNRGWWESRYAPPTFIQYKYADEVRQQTRVSLDSSCSGGHHSEERDASCNKWSRCICTKLGDKNCDDSSMKRNVLSSTQSQTCFANAGCCSYVDPCSVNNQPEIILNHDGCCYKLGVDCIGGNQASQTHTCDDNCQRTSNDDSVETQQISQALFYNKQRDDHSTEEPMHQPVGLDSCDFNHVESDYNLDIHLTHHEFFNDPSSANKSECGLDDHSEPRQLNTFEAHDVWHGRCDPEESSQTQPLDIGSHCNNAEIRVGNQFEQQNSLNNCSCSNENNSTVLNRRKPNLGLSETRPGYESMDSCPQALFCCYFNNTKVFNEYLREYNGPLLIVIGSAGGARNTEPVPLEYQGHDHWNLVYSAPLYQGNDYEMVAVYRRKSSLYM